MDATECTGKTALLIGCRENNTTVCKYLISNGCDVNTVDQLGHSALYFAAHNSNPSVTLCQKLFRHGYTAKHDSDWLSDDVHHKLSQTGIISRVFIKLGFTKPKLDFPTDNLSDDYLDTDLSRQM